MFGPCKFPRENIGFSKNRARTAVPRIFLHSGRSDALDVIDTATRKIIKTLHVGQDPQALIYVAGAVPEGKTGTLNLKKQGLNMKVANLPITIQEVQSTSGLPGYA